MLSPSNHSHNTQPTTMKRSHVSTRHCPLLLLAASTLFLFVFLLLSAAVGPTTTFQEEPHDPTRLPGDSLPRFAYLISGTRGDAPRVKRILRAAHHARNHYVVHLDLEASDEERRELAGFASAAGLRNVMVVGKGNLVTSKGPTALAATLHAVAILLRRAPDWDWFVNLAAADYPLLSQDDLVHIFSYLPRDLNFLEHSSDIGIKENQRGRPIIIDSGLYHSKKSGIFWAKERRSLPASFKLFMGSSQVILSKPFVDFCVRGWDNLPRTLLLYYTNVLSSTEGYFHTIACNHKDYQNTTVNHDLRYTKWEALPSQHPVPLTSEHFDDMVRSGAPFARNVARDDAVLDRIDKELLRRQPCVGRSGSGKDPCLIRANANAIRPTLDSKRLEKLVVKLLDPENFRAKQCK